VLTGTPIGSSPPWLALVGFLDNPSWEVSLVWQKDFGKKATATIPCSKTPDTVKCAPTNYLAGQFLLHKKL